jgi:hypothetical protein
MGAFDITRLQSEKPRSPHENGGRRIPKFQLKQATALVSDAQRHLTQSSVGLAQRSFMAALKVMDGAFGTSEVDRLRAACQVGLAAAQSRRDLGGTSARGSTANPLPAAAHAPAGDKVAGSSRRADTASPLPGTAPPGAKANGRCAVADGGKREGQAAGRNEDQALRGAAAGRLGPGPAALGDAEKGGVRGGGGVESRARLDSAVPARGATRAGEGARRLDAHIARRSPDAGQGGGPGDGEHRDPAAAAAAPSRSAERTARSQALAEGGRASAGGSRRGAAPSRRGRDAAGDAGAGAGAGAWERVGAKDAEPRTDLGQLSREQARPSPPPPPSACRRTDSGPRLRDSRPLCAASGPERRAAPRARAPPPLRRQVLRCARGPRAPLAHPLEAWCARHPAARAISQPPEPCACPAALGAHPLTRLRSRLQGHVARRAGQRSACPAPGGARVRPPAAAWDGRAAGRERRAGGRRALHARRGQRAQRGAAVDAPLVRVHGRRARVGTGGARVGTAGRGAGRGVEPAGRARVRARERAAVRAERHPDRGGAARLLQRGARLGKGQRGARLGKGRIRLVEPRVRARPRPRRAAPGPARGANLAWPRVTLRSVEGRPAGAGARAAVTCAWCGRKGTFRRRRACRAAAGGRRGEAPPRRRAARRRP